MGNGWIFLKQIHLTSIHPAPENRYQALFLTGKQSFPGRLAEITLDPFRDLLISLGSGKIRHLGLICHSLPGGFDTKMNRSNFFFPTEAHLQGSAQNWKPSGRFRLQQPTSWTPGPQHSVPSSRPGLGLGLSFICTAVLHAGSSLCEAEELMQGNSWAWEKWVSTKAICPVFKLFFFFFPYTFLKQIYC